MEKKHRAVFILFTIGLLFFGGARIAHATYRETLNIYQYKIGGTISWVHAYDGSLDPVGWATLTIIADDVDDSEHDEVYFNEHFLGYLNNQGYYSNWGYTPGPGAVGNSSLTTTIFQLDPSWIESNSPTNVVVESGWGVEIETSTLTAGRLECTTSVPYFNQCNKSWKDESYDHFDATKDYSYDHYAAKGTVCNWGCALTSAVMVLNYYDIETNPENLNDWLKNRFKDQNRNGELDPGEEAYGYTRDGDVNWYEVANYSKGAISYNGPIWERNDSILNSDLCNQHPVILRVPGHFVVATGKTKIDDTDTWNINDPYWSERTGLLSYGNNYSSMRRFSPRRADNSAMMIRAHSPVELYLIDPQGRALGMDPTSGLEINGIPESFYYSEKPLLGLPEVKIIEILNPIDGDYTIKVVGVDAGSYSLDFYNYDKSGNLSTTGTFTEEVAPGEIDDWELSYSSIVNQLPVADPGGPYLGYISFPITFDASGSYDPEGQPLKYRWDFDSDGTWDTDWSNEPTSTHTWWNFWAGLSTLEVSDGMLTATNTASVAIKGPKDLKEDVISKLENAKTGDEKVDQKIEEVLKYLEESIDDSLWVDGNHLDPQKGTEVFQAEAQAVRKMSLYLSLEKWSSKRWSDHHNLPESVRSVFEQAIDDLVKADEVLAKTAIEEAKDTPVQNSRRQRIVDWMISQAAREKKKGSLYLENSPERAILAYKQAWFFTQQAIKYAKQE